MRCSECGCFIIKEREVYVVHDPKVYCWACSKEKTEFFDQMQATGASLAQVLRTDGYGNTESAPRAVNAIEVEDEAPPPATEDVNE
ncbi:hypothetical protein LCGC14_2580200 [marine sediment metagenome]|uniref:Uncharacterized protein n=1 Tax=marine sediment metagenome TaxID=412755 RepID=A0A0F9B2J7_9ZZZZ